MKKKLFPICYIVFLTPLLFSCNKWLDVQPENSVSERVLFDSEQGFRNAINGIYLDLAEPSLYGAELSFGALSVLSHNYKLTSGPYVSMAEFDYENIQNKPILTGFWQKMYRIIANCNNVIQEVQKKDSSFFMAGKVEQDVVLGEALAMRGFLHFELARLYAPAPIVNTADKIIPYYEHYPSHGEAKLSTAELLKKAAADLLRAKDLLAFSDTVFNTYGAFASPISRITGGYAPNGGAFFNKRGTRLNYYAVNGLLARLYLYAGDKPAALQHALEVQRYASSADLARRYFVFTPESELLSDITSRNRKLTNDIIWAVYNKYTLDNFDNTINRTAGVFVASGKSLFVPDVDDFRNTKLLELAGNNLIAIKFKRAGGNGVVDNSMGRIIPMLRLSEVYYILGECYIDTNPAEAANYLNLVRKGRGITGNPIADNISRNDYMAALLRDARKEFIGEGQLFFLYKRLNLPVMQDEEKPIVLGSKFMLPIPDSETAL